METRAEAIDRLTAEYAEKLAKLPDEHPGVPVEAFRQALEESVAKTGRVRFLRRPPTFRDRPHGSMFLRLYRWHGGGGNFDGYFFAKWDCDAHRRRHPEFPTFDQWDTTAIVARGGSPAVQRWADALGVQR